MKVTWTRIRDYENNRYEWVCVHGVHHSDYPGGCLGGCDGCCKKPEYPGRKVI